MKQSKKRYPDKNLQIIFGITLTAVMGVTSITPAFPKILDALKITTHAIGLLITVFTLPGVILAPVMGIMADRYGRKRILVPSLMLFGLAGGICAFTRDFNLLLLLRFFQGVGAASLGALNSTILGDLYTGKERTRVMGYNTSVLSIGTAAYPAIGGALAMFGWFYPFLLPFLAIPLGLTVLFFLNNPEPKGRKQLKEQFSSALKSMKDRQVIGLFTASVITFIILYGPCLTYFPLLMGRSFMASPLEIGLIFTVMSLVTAVTSSQLGKIMKRYDERSLVRFAFLLYGAAVLIIPFVRNQWLFLVPIMIFGLGQGINLPCIQSLLAGLAPMEYRATFMSINGMVLRLGQTLGPLLMGFVFSVWGMEAAFYAASGLSIFMFLYSFIMLK